MPIQIPTEKYTSKQLLLCIEQGWKAAHEGLSLRDNPYTFNTEPYDYWRIGYLTNPEKDEDDRKPFY